MTSILHHELVIEVDDLELDYSKIVGAGGFGSVWLAKWNGPGGGLQVAVKQVHRKQSTSILPLIKEVETAAALHHKCISRVYGYCQVTDDDLWLVLEYVEGGDLHKHLAKGPLPWRVQIKFALDAARAVNYLHTRSPPILHRDLKAQNFLVQGDSLLLTDFGMAKIQAEISNTNSTCNWSAPEVLNENAKWSNKSDIYSLGMVFYEITAQVMPYADEVDNFAIIRLIKSGNRPAIPSTCPKVCFEKFEIR